MKVLFAIKALNDIKGGAERVLADVTAGLANKDNDISVISFDSPNGKSFYPINEKVKRICLNIGNTHHKSTFKESLSRIKALRRTVKEENPDVVVAFMHSMFVPMSIALIGTGIPVIASEHIVPEHYKNRRLEFFLILLSSMLVKKITVLSESIKTSYPKNLQKKMVSISNPVYQPKFLACPLGKNDDRKIILNVGRLDPQKDQKTLIKAFAKIAHNYPDWDLRIIGDGELKEELLELIKGLKLEGRAFLPGSTPNITLEYKRSHIFVLPSLYESFGLATAEAMAHGLPVIGFVDCPGTNKLIKNGENGMLLQGSDRVSAIAKALDILITDPDLRVYYGQHGVKTAKFYSIDNIINKWEKLLK